MKGIRLENISKSFNGEEILKHLNLIIPSGSFFALLGPSGSGKTTLLRLIAGFEAPQTGKIFLGDKDITDEPIHQRRVNTVFQNYALFPHMNVFENIAYSLTIRRVPKKKIEEKVLHILRIVHLEKQIHKSIHQLSGGQKQRVALARAVINEPDVLLLDEPLAALDLKLREKMLLELVELQDTLKTTFIYITHDQFEALTVADYMAIMDHEGNVEQVGTPKEIYEFPKTSFVAKFVGSTNLFKGLLRLAGEKKQIEIDGLGLFTIVIPKERKWAYNGAEVFMSLRPEKIEINKHPVQGFANELRGVVESIVYHGRSTQYNVRLKSGEIISTFEQNEEHFPQEVIDYDDTVYLYWQKENIVLLER